MTFDRDLVEHLRRLSDREVKVNRWLASARALQLETEARSYRSIEALMASESDRRAQALADLDPDGGGVA